MINTLRLNVVYLENGFHLLLVDSQNKQITKAPLSLHPWTFFPRSLHAQSDKGAAVEVKQCGKELAMIIHLILAAN